MITKFMSIYNSNLDIDPSKFYGLEHDLDVTKSVIDSYKSFGIDIGKVKSPACFIIKPNYQNKIEVEFYTKGDELLSAIIAASLDKTTMFTLSRYFENFFDEESETFSQIYSLSHDLEKSDVYDCDAVLKSYTPLLKELATTLDEMLPNVMKSLVRLDNLDLIESNYYFIKSLQLSSIEVDESHLVSNVGNYVSGMFPINKGACSVENLGDSTKTEIAELVNYSVGKDFCDVDAFSTYGNNNVVFSITLLECLCYLLNEIIEKKNESESEDACEVL